MSAFSCWCAFNNKREPANRECGVGNLKIGVLFACKIFYPIHLSVHFYQSVIVWSNNNIG